MQSLRLKFKGISEHSDSVDLEEYEVNSDLKESLWRKRKWCGNN